MLAKVWFLFYRRKLIYCFSIQYKNLTFFLIYLVSLWTLKKISSWNCSCSFYSKPSKPFCLCTETVIERGGRSKTDKLKITFFLLNDVDFLDSRVNNSINSELFDRKQSASWTKFIIAVLTSISNVHWIVYDQKEIVLIYFIFVFKEASGCI